MILFGFQATTLILVALLMVACGGGIGRLLWLIEGRPALDRPTWWPGDASPASASVPTKTGKTSHKGVVACAACCGVPMIVVVGIMVGVVSVGAVALVSLAGAVVLAIALVTWSVATGHASEWWRAATHR